MKMENIHVLVTCDMTEEYRVAPVPDLRLEEWLQEFPSASAETRGMGLAVHHPYLCANQVRGIPSKSLPVPYALGGQEGHHFTHKVTLQLGILWSVQLAWNIPLLSVKKPHTNDYRPVQDLREVNKRVIDIHSIVPNPYTLLSSQPADQQWYTVLDLKDAFF